MTSPARVVGKLHPAAWKLRALALAAIFRFEKKAACSPFPADSHVRQFPEQKWTGHASGL